MELPAVSSHLRGLALSLSFVTSQVALPRLSATWPTSARVPCAHAALVAHAAVAPLPLPKRAAVRDDLPRVGPGALPPPVLALPDLPRARVPYGVA
eukprot:2251354-Prymnesium_polylepis.1